MKFVDEATITVVGGDRVLIRWQISDTLARSGLSAVLTEADAIKQASPAKTYM